ncbi:Sugar kinase of the NBD/HSP70 family, may contain an N-terminal HTH domain [Rhizobium tibeticum]|uniref:N-acetylglucosamine repressor n=1 Tax=Rhizobium tibeticum TaxID=501024 RepID=A0A1H8PTL7_9HYPH|nr:ROK family transcriptional regulator [Rhizobium tibeticum]SEH98942.1 N-acetylglucosamine repressor [Rhizobium tibeticum]SEO44883.1 Sugar kinase of the NBD/HSP70 family, may contain an N-terminal HTH domain [Rhizobium tibeticum]
MKGNASTSRAMNRRLILNLLRNRGPVSRAELALITGLSPAAVTFVVTELIEDRLLVEREAVTSSNGRRPIPVDINYEAHLALGFKLNRSSIDCVLTDLATIPLATMETAVVDTSPEGMIEAIKDAIPRLLAEAGREERDIMGIGVSIPGEVDPTKGVCLQSPRFGWYDLPFAELLAERVRVPVWIDDDVNAFAIAQKLFGAGRNHRNFAALAIGAGIGCSLVLNGEIYHGSNGAAGKLGHITTIPQGDLCECGRRGCLMAHAAEPYMIAEWGRKRGKPATRTDFVAAAEADEETAVAILQEAGSRIGRHLADLVNLFDPEIIVVGGEAVQFGEALLGPLKRSMNEFLFFSRPELQTDWVPSSWARGAAALATQSIFDFERSPSG